jgi:hypothetical protein
MNDPGTAEPIRQTERDMEKHLENGDNPMYNDEVYNFLDPRYAHFIFFERKSGNFANIL